MLYLGTEGRYDLPHHNISISSDYEKNLDEIENRHVLSGEPRSVRARARVRWPGR